MCGTYTAYVGHTRQSVNEEKLQDPFKKKKKIRKGQISLGHYFLSPIHSLPH